MTQQVPDEVIEKYYMDKDAPPCDWKHFKYAFLAGMKHRDEQEMCCSCQKPMDSFTVCIGCEGKA